MGVMAKLGLSTSRNRVDQTSPLYTNMSNSKTGEFERDKEKSALSIYVGQKLQLQKEKLMHHKSRQEGFFESKHQIGKGWPPTNLKPLNEITETGLNSVNNLPFGVKSESQKIKEDHEESKTIHTEDNFERFSETMPINSVPAHSKQKQKLPEKRELSREPTLKIPRAEKEMPKQRPGHTKSNSSRDLYALRQIPKAKVIDQSITDFKNHLLGQINSTNKVTRSNVNKQQFQSEFGGPIEKIASQSSLGLSRQQQLVAGSKQSSEIEFHAYQTEQDQHANDDSLTKYEREIEALTRNSL